MAMAVPNSVSIDGSGTVDSGTVRTVEMPYRWRGSAPGLLPEATQALKVSVVDPV